MPNSDCLQALAVRDHRRVSAAKKDLLVLQHCHTVRFVLLDRCARLHSGCHIGIRCPQPGLQKAECCACQLEMVSEEPHAKLAFPCLVKALCFNCRAGHLGFAVLRCSFKSYLRTISDKKGSKYCKIISAHDNLSSMLFQYDLYVFRSSAFLKNHLHPIPNTAPSSQTPSSGLSLALEEKQFFFNASILIPQLVFLNSLTQIKDGTELYKR